MKYYPVQVKSMNGYTVAIAIRIVQDMDFPTMFGRGTVTVVDYVSDYLFNMPQYKGRYQVIPFPTFTLESLSDTEYFDEYGIIYDADDYDGY